MLMLGYDKCQNSYEGNQLQSTTTQTSTQFAYKIQMSFMLELHDPSEWLNELG